MSEPIYMVGQISVKDIPVYLERYAAPVAEQLHARGAEILAGDMSPQVLEGDWPGNWTFIVKFPSAGIATEWYNSKEYLAFKKMRLTELTSMGNLVLMGSIPPSA